MKIEGFKQIQQTRRGISKFWFRKEEFQFFAKKRLTNSFTSWTVQNIVDLLDIKQIHFFHRFFLFHREVQNRLPSIKMKRYECFRVQVQDGRHNVHHSVHVVRLHHGTDYFFVWQFESWWWSMQHISFHCCIIPKLWKCCQLTFGRKWLIESHSIEKGKLSINIHRRIKC